MKKFLTISAALLLTASLFVSCASTSKNAEVVPEEPAVEVPSEPVKLVYGVDYWLEPVFGADYVALDGQTIIFNKGATNSNHAIMFTMLDTTKFYKNFVIKIDYELGNYDSSKSCQVCIQPASLDGADYNYTNCSYPVLFDQSKPDAEKSFNVNINKLLKSSVKKELAGFRIVGNNGTYEKFVWQDDWSFTITKVTLAPEPENLGLAK